MSCCFAAEAPYRRDGMRGRRAKAPAGDGMAAAVGVLYAL